MTDTTIQPGDFIVKRLGFGEGYEKLRVVTATAAQVRCDCQGWPGRQRFVRPEDVLIHTPDENLADQVLVKIKASADRQEQALMQVRQQHKARIAKIVAEARS